MKPEDENFAIALCDQSKSHDDWLCIVRFGLKTLLENPVLLVEIISREADAQLGRKAIPSRVLADEIREIFQELKLKLVLSD